MWADIIKMIADFLKSNKEEKIENKKKLSKIFLEISDLLYTVYDKLESDIYPQYSCLVMENLSKDMYEELKGKMPDNKLDELYNMLLISSKLEGEYANRKEIGVKKQLLLTSAKFKSLSLLYS
jgi:hypothetical protein